MGAVPGIVGVGGAIAGGVTGIFEGVSGVGIDFEVGAFAEGLHGGLEGVDVVGGDAAVKAVAASVPELPARKRARFLREHGLREYDAEVLTATRAIAEDDETAAAVSGEPKTAANWVTGESPGLLKAEGKEISDSPVSARQLGELVGLIARGEISGKMAKEIFAKMFASGEAPGAIIEREGLKQTRRCGGAREDRRRGDRQLSQAGGAVQERENDGPNFLVGQAMKASRGQANVAVVTEILKKKLG